jgi:hypothetical protein
VTWQLERAGHVGPIQYRLIIISRAFEAGRKTKMKLGGAGGGPCTSGLVSSTAGM